MAFAIAFADETVTLNQRKPRECADPMAAELFEARAEDEREEARKAWEQGAVGALMGVLHHGQARLWSRMAARARGEIV